MWIRTQDAIICRAVDIPVGNARRYEHGIADFQFDLGTVWPSHLDDNPASRTTQGFMGSGMEMVKSIHTVDPGNRPTVIAEQLAELFVEPCLLFIENRSVQAKLYWVPKS